MLELKYGDICLGDLSKSLNSPKSGIVPLVFISFEVMPDGAGSYRFCRIGKKPVSPTASPFVDVNEQPCLRCDSAIFPTQLVVFSDESAIIRKVGSVEDENLISQIREIRKAEKREQNQAMIMALCPRCRKEFLYDPSNTVKRLDPFSVQEHQCDFCQTRNGHTYIIFKRKLYGGDNK